MLGANLCGFLYAQLPHGRPTLLANRRALSPSPLRYLWQGKRSGLARILSGRRLDILDPSPSTRAERIAHGWPCLAWNGRPWRYPFSCAAPVLVLAVPAPTQRPMPAALYTLLHDAPIT